MVRIESLSALAAFLVLTGCVEIVEPNPYPYWAQNITPAEAVGALTGGALGGYLGAQFGAGTGAIAMTGLGVAAGAALGRELAREMENPDHPFVVSLCDGYGRCQPLSSGSGPLPRDLAPSDLRK
jgi:uncharacterized protein YcfJ